MYKYSMIAKLYIILKVNIINIYDINIINVNFS